MSALDGFYTAWGNARRTFGEGVPQGGDRLDAGDGLCRLGAAVAAAAPGSAWSGSAANAYEAANTGHQGVLLQLGMLDRRLGAQIDRSADAVTVGRRNLDAVYRWVTDAAASVPPGKLGDAMLVRIAMRGLEQLSDVVTGTQAESAGVAEQLRRLRELYEELFGEPRAPEADEAAEPDPAAPPTCPAVTSTASTEPIANFWRRCSTGTSGCPTVRSRPTAWPTSPRSARPSPSPARTCCASSGPPTRRR